MNDGGSRDDPRMPIVCPRRREPLVNFAAEELRRYMGLLFGLHPQIVDEARGPHLHVGPPRGSAADLGLDSLGDQGYVLKRLKRNGADVLMCAGASPRATLWAVYELVELWGVRYLLHGDILPSRGPFRLPQVEMEATPELTVRAWPLVGDLAIGTEAWGTDDCIRLIDQLAKLRFNRIGIANYGYYQPFIDLRYKGVRRKRAGLFYGDHYPITDDMIGRELFGDEKEFWNPDLPPGASFEEQLRAGQNHVHRLLDHAHSRGMECGIDVQLTIFPLEFAALVPGAQKVHQLGGLGVVPGSDVTPEDPALIELCSLMLRATIDTYPQVDYVDVSMPEFRQWVGRYEDAWRVLDEQYGIERVRPLAEVLRQAARRTDYPGGAQRAVHEVKGDIVNLLFFDRLFNRTSPQRASRRPDMKFVLHGVAEELFPILPYVLREGWETVNGIDYTPDRIIKRLDQVVRLRDQRIPFSLYYTLHDDNVGVLPQLSTGSLHTITGALLRNNWSGYRIRYKMAGDHDMCVNFLSWVSWRPDTRPEDVYRDLITAICGPECLAEMLEVFRGVEAATILLEWHGLGATFPTSDMITKHWIPEEFPRELALVRQGYGRALDAATRARAKIISRGGWHVDYWIGRLRFGISYLDAIKACRLGAGADVQGRRREALAHARQALHHVVEALKAFARVAQDQSDRGAIAVMNEFVCRVLRRKVHELQSAVGAGRGNNVNEIRIGILGAGWGLTRAAKFAQIDDCRVTLGWSRSPLKRALLSRRTGARSEETWRAVCQSGQVDAIVVATPNAFHFEQALAAIEARKHVLVETPLAMTSAEAEQLARLAEERGVVLHHGAKGRYHPEHPQRLANMRRAGAPVYAEVTACWADAPDKAWFHDPKLSGGAFALLPYTCVEFYELFGDPVAVDGKHTPRSGLDFATIWLEYAGGAHARVCRGTGKGIATAHFGMIVGSEGTVVWGEDHMRLLQGQEAIDLPPCSDADAVLCECAAFIDEIRGRRDFRPDLELDLRIMRAVDEAKRKAASRG